MSKCQRPLGMIPKVIKTSKIYCYDKLGGDEALKRRHFKTHCSSGDDIFIGPVDASRKGWCPLDTPFGKVARRKVWCETPSKPKPEALWSSLDDNMKFKCCTSGCGSYNHTQCPHSAVLGSSSCDKFMSNYCKNKDADGKLIHADVPECGCQLPEEEYVLTGPLKLSDKKCSDTRAYKTADQIFKNLSITDCSMGDITLSSKELSSVDNTKIQQLCGSSIEELMKQSNTVKEDNVEEDNEEGKKKEKDGMFFFPTVFKLGIEKLLKSKDVMTSSQVSAYVKMPLSMSPNRINIDKKEKVSYFNNMIRQSITVDMLNDTLDILRNNFVISEYNIDPESTRNLILYTESIKKDYGEAYEASGIGYTVASWVAPFANTNSISKPSTQYALIFGIILAVLSVLIGIYYAFRSKS